MGRGVISDGGTDGQYTISLDYGEDIADSIIAQLTAQAAVLESDIDALEAEIALLEISQASLQLLLSASITTYNASEKTDADKETLAQVSASV
jgi:prefoldin subunit 5